MENRVKIGDEWYVKESTLKQDKKLSFKIDEDDIIKGKISLWEDDRFCFEGFHNIDTGVLESIEFTDKRNQDYPFTEIDYWDNEIWFKRVIDLDEGVWEEFDEGDTEIIETIKAFIDIAYNLYL